MSFAICVLCFFILAPFGLSNSQGEGLLTLCRENVCVQWNLSLKDTLNKGPLSNEDTVCCINGIELCTNLPLN